MPLDDMLEFAHRRIDRGLEELDQVERGLGVAMAIWLALRPDRMPADIDELRAFGVEQGILDAV